MAGFLTAEIITSEPAEIAEAPDSGPAATGTTAEAEAPAADGGEGTSPPVKPPRRQDSPENLIHVRNNQTAQFYARLGQRMLFGTEKPTQDEVIITGLGRATGAAVGAAALMCNDERVQIISVKTDLWDSIARSGGRNGMYQSGRGAAQTPRRIPKITVTLAKIPGATGGLSPMTTVSTAAAESPAA